MEPIAEPPIESTKEGEFFDTIRPLSIVEQIEKNGDEPFLLLVGSHPLTRRGFVVSKLRCFRTFPVFGRVYALAAYNSNKELVVSFSLGTEWELIGRDLIETGVERLNPRLDFSDTTRRTVDDQIGQYL